MSSQPPEFQRARRPEQIEARRRAILSTARGMLGERSLADISLRELSLRVGLSKSNVLRYFDSREAIFLELLDTESEAWLDALEAVLAAGGQAGEAAEAREATGEAEPYAVEVRLASAVADTLYERPLLCELIGSMSGVLERNISVDFARAFKRRATGHTERLAVLVGSRLPRLGGAASGQFAAAVIVITAGLWPYANPTEAVATVTAEMGYPPTDETFPHALREALITHLIGLSASPHRFV
jgi:AcrR family transcriptional regulator